MELLERGQNYGNDPIRQYVLSSNLNYARPRSLRGRKKRSEVQIVSDDDEFVLTCVAHECFV